MRAFTLCLSESNQEWLENLSDEELNMHINIILSMSKRVVESMHPTQISPEVKAELEIIKGMISVAMPRVLQMHHNSSVKGDEGEKSADKLIENAFPHIIVEDTSADAKCGDRRLTIGDASILLEFKHYKNTVPTKEVDKFVRDLKMSGCMIGIFCSITSSIAKKPKNISFEPCGSAVAVFIPFSGESHTKLITIISWAEWFINSRIDNLGTTATATTLELSMEALLEIDELNKQLDTSIEQLERSINQLTTVKHSSITMLKSKLSVLNKLIRNNN